MYITNRTALRAMNIPDTLPYREYKHRKSRIMIIGAGSAGGNILKEIYLTRNYDTEKCRVDFLAVNRDDQALEHMPSNNNFLRLLVENSIISFSSRMTESDIIRLRARISGYMAVIVVAGLGGATGSYLAPEITKVAKELGILTIAVASMPFSMEGKRRLDRAIDALEELKVTADSVLVLSNDALLDLYGSLPLIEAFHKSDEYFKLPIDFVMEIIQKDWQVNVDFADLESALRNAGLSAFTWATVKKADGTMQTLDSLFVSPYMSLANLENIKSALISIEYGREEINAKEINQILETIRNRLRRQKTNIIWGTRKNESLYRGVTVKCIFAGYYENNTQPLSEAENIQVSRQIPTYLVESVNKIKSDYPGKKIAFLIMRFGQGGEYDRIVSTIKTELAKKNIAVLRADDKEYHENLLYNILSYIYASDFGIAVFERIRDEIVNPNITFEVGYMMAINKPVCLLKEKTMQRLHTDIIGMLYREFDLADLQSTLKSSLHKWISDKELLS